jgi:hypothetical protein
MPRFYCSDQNMLPSFGTSCLAGILLTALISFNTNLSFRFITQRVETDTEDRVEMQQHTRHDLSPSFASIVKRPQIRITLQRNEEFVQWLTENKNDFRAI